MTSEKMQPRVSTLRLARPAIAAIAFAGLVSSAFAATVFQISDAVTSGGGQNVFASDPASTFTGTTSTRLIYNNGTSGSYFVAKFPETVSLTNVGDKITFDWTVAVTNGANSGGQAFRVGLFDVGTATDSNFGTSTGYRADYGTSTNNRGFYERTGSNAGLFTAGAYTQYNVNDYASGDRGSFTRTFATSPVTFSGSFSIELLDAKDRKVRISTVLGTGTVASIIDDASAFTAFNSVAIWIAGAAGTSGLDFSNLTVTLTAAAVPEPAAAAAWLSAGLALAGIMLRKRRQREL